MKERAEHIDGDHEDECCELCQMLGIRDVILIDELASRGVTVRAPDEIPPNELAAEICRIAGELARLRVFLEHTDHLTDEELYRRLWDETLHGWSFISPDDPMGATHVDFVGSGSDEDHLAWLTYYADDAGRAEAQSWEPGLRLPERKTPPFDRSATLPRATNHEGQE
jgi:hypothetical protein